MSFKVLVVDDPIFDFNEEFDVLYIKDLKGGKVFRDIIIKYKNRFDSLRWSLKSIFMINLLEIQKFEQVYFVDCDIYFFSDFRFLYNELSDHSFLLSPHWGCIHPNKSELYFSSFMTSGLYNAGFLGATNKGLSTLYWWSEMCLYACEVDKNRGLFVDQSYLNIFPILNPDTILIRHKGCNVADWNRFEVKRGLDSEGKLILDNEFPLVFIHFTNLGYLVEHDPLLIPYLEKYEQELKGNGFLGSLISSANNFVLKQKLKRLTLFERFIRRVVGKDRFLRLKSWKN